MTEEHNIGIQVEDTEDRGRKVLRNFGILPYHYTASQPRWPWIYIAAKTLNLW